MPNVARHARVICPYYRTSFQRKNGVWAIACEGIAGDRTVSEFRKEDALRCWMVRACEGYGYVDVCPIARLNAGKYENVEGDNHE